MAAEPLPPHLTYKYAILEFFEYAHLPPRLQDASRAFAKLAHEVANANEGTNAETAAALRKLLEAKDCAVRAEIVATRKALTEREDPR